MENRPSENRHLHKGDKLFFKGKIREAKNEYKKALELEPKNAVAWNNLGRCHVVFRKLEDAIECYEKAIAINPRYFVAIRNMKKAQERLEKIKPRKEKDIPTFQSKGEEYLQNEDYGKALLFYNQKLRKDPEDAKAWMNKGHALLKKGYPGQALHCFKKAESIDSGFLTDEHFSKLKKESSEFKTRKATAYREKGDELTRKKAYEKAIKYYQLSLKEDESMVQSMNNIGVAYVSLYLYKEALKHFDKAIQMDPDYVKANVNREKCIKLYASHKKRLKSAEVEAKKQKKEIPWCSKGMIDEKKVYVYIICGTCKTKFKVRQKDVSQGCRVICPSCDSLGVLSLEDNCSSQP